jgi:hypothetical protein
MLQATKSPVIHTIAVASNVVTGRTLGNNPPLRAGHTCFPARTEAMLRALHHHSGTAVNQRRLG